MFWKKWLRTIWYLMICLNVNIGQNSNILLIHKGLYSTHCIIFG